MQIFKNKWSVIAIAIFCSLLWGSAFPVLKISYTELQIAIDDTAAKIVFAGGRFFLAGIMLLVLLLFTQPKNLFFNKKQFLILLILGIVQTSIQYFFFYNGLANVTGMQGSILSSAGTFFTVIIAHYFYKNDKINRKKLVGIIAGFTGIIVANWGQSFSLNFTFTGEGYMILAALAGAIGTILAKELATDISPLALSGWQLTLGASVLLLIGLPQLNENAIIFTPFGTGLFIYSAFLSAAAFCLWYSILKYNKAGELSIYKFIIPVSGTVLSAMFIPGEKLNLFIILAIILVAIGITAINYKGKESNKNKYHEHKAS